MRYLARLSFVFGLFIILFFQNSAISDTVAEPQINESLTTIIADNNLIDASKNGEVNDITLKRFVNKGGNINAKDEYGLTALHYAANWGHWEAVRILIENGAETNSKDKNQRTPIFNATIMGEIKIINFLAKRGADINVKDIHGLTPVSVAAFTGNIESMKALISNGANLTHLGYNKETALHLAVLLGHKEMVKFLIKNNKVDVTATTSSGFTAKQLSEQWARPKISSLLNDIKTTKPDNAYSSFEDETLVPVGNFIMANMPLVHFTPIYSNWNDRVLVQRKKPIITNKVINFDPQKSLTVKVVCQALLSKIHLSGYTPIPIGENFMVLVENKEVFNNVIVTLNKFNIETRSEDGNTLLHDAASSGNFLLLKNLIFAGAEINSVNAKRMTPLHYVSGFKAKEITELLVSKGANVNFKGEDNWTPLHSAVAKNLLNVAKLLIDQGADVNAKYQNSWSPLDYVQENSEHLAKFLRSNGAKTGKQLKESKNKD